MLKRFVEFLTCRYGSLRLGDVKGHYYVSDVDKLIFISESSFETFQFLSDNLRIIKGNRYVIVIAGGGGDILYCHRISKLIKDYYIPVHVEWCRSAGCNYAFIEHCSVSPNLILDTHGRGDMVPREDMIRILDDHLVWMSQFSMYYDRVPYRNFIKWQVEKLTEMWRDRGVTCDLRECWFSESIDCFRSYLYVQTLDDLIKYKSNTNNSNT